MNAIEIAAEAPGWSAATAPAATECRTLSADIDAEICVIGGGIAGLTLGRELARRGWSVALLAAGRIGADGAARHAGIVAPGFPEACARKGERLGRERAREIGRLSTSGVDYVRRTLAETGMESDATAHGCLVPQRRDDADACRDQAERAADIFATPAEMWPTERVRAALRSAVHHQALHLPQAFAIDPLRYALKLAADARQRGLRIYECTPALALDAAGIRKRVVTPKGRVRAQHIVLTTASENARLYPALAGTVMTLHAPIGLSAPSPDALAAAIPFRGAVGGPLAAAHRVVADGRLLWAGPLGASPASPRRLPGRLRRQMRRLYPQLDAVAVERTWSVSADYAVHRMPQIGMLAPGVWLAGAFGHHALANASMGAELIAAAIHAGDDRWRLFRSYGLAWTGGAAGRALIALALCALRLRLRMQERLAPRLPAAGTDAAAASAAILLPSAVAAAAPDAPAMAKARAKPRRRTAKAERAAPAKPPRAPKPAIRPKEKLAPLAAKPPKLHKPRRRRPASAPPPEPSSPG